MTVGRQPVVAVIGGSQCTKEEGELAQAVGRLLAAAGAVVLCGGYGGVMERVAQGVQEEGGLVLGLLSGATREGANPYLSVALPTGMGEMRNALIVRGADAAIAIGGGFGTLSEIALALRLGKPVVGLNTWEFRDPAGSPDPVRRVTTAAEAVALALQSARG